ncbi:MAG TPA: HesA/MoeB/ThiF family protein [Thermoanaerobaculia bacterium]|jgi:molybdopterin/thiamine biosynthesis adenylyltransferase|nr:HesA/MoeB/ThiF family protein [Thermoanaerobaculia bacterium]
MTRTDEFGLTELDHEIYARQLRLPGFGPEEQGRLKRASVLVSRVGGLGGTSAMALARAGVGRLILAHDGVVEPENLNRMHLAFREDLGRPRVEAFRDTLKRINPDLEVVVTAENISDRNAVALFEQADVVIDGAPLFEERQAMNREAVRRGKPLVMAAMFALEGYLTVIEPGSTPCLTCLYPEMPPQWTIDSFAVIACSSMVVATLAAMEAIKLLTGYGEVLRNRLLYFDLTDNSFRKLKVSRRPDCPVCGHLPWPEVPAATEFR